MQVKEVRIYRTESYETPGNTIVGTVSLSGETGTQTIRLSTATIAQIFAIIAKDAQRVANANVVSVSKAIEDAQHERMVLEMHSGALEA